MGTYKYSESPTPNLDHGVLHTGPLNGSGGTWTQLNVPSNLTSGTVANTILHSVMGELVVGNYDLAGVPNSGNAFLYNTTSNACTIFNLGGTQNLTTAYGVWKNSADSYTIVGGSQIGGINKAFVLDYVLSTESFGTPTYFAPRGESADIVSHFEGVSGLGNGGYSLVGMTLDSGSNPTGVDYGVATWNPDGSLSHGGWVAIAVPDASMTTGNTVVDDIALGIYTTSTSAGVAAYVATVPEPGSSFMATIGACLSKDRDVLLAFGDFPAEHWGHVRTTNPIETTFATIRLRHRRTKGSWSRRASLTMMFKLAQSASRRWRSVASGG